MINQEKQKLICRSCLNCRINLEHGITCNLTKKKADFLDKCEQFIDKSSVTQNSIADSDLRFGFFGSRSL